MKANIKTTILTSLVIGAVMAASTPAHSATVTVDPSATWLGFMNVFNLPADGGGYQFGSGWGTADLNAVFTGPLLKLTPNTSISRDVPLTDGYWWKPDGSPNKNMDASMYVQQDGSLAGQTVTFTGNVLANTLVSPYASVAFIKDFAPDYSSFNTISAPLVNGVFSINLATVNDPLRHVQYGFETVGPNARNEAGQAAALGFAQITAVPEPTSLALVGLGVLGVIRSRRQRSH